MVAMWLLSIFILQSQILIIDFLFYLGSKISPEKDKGSES